MINTSYTVQDWIDARPTIEVWDENWDVIALFDLHRTQWRMTMAGPGALDMSIFLHELDRKKVPPDEYDEFISKLSVIESAALVHIHR